MKKYIGIILIGIMSCQSHNEIDKTFFGEWKGKKMTYCYNRVAISLSEKEDEPYLLQVFNHCEDDGFKAHLIESYTCKYQDGILIKNEGMEKEVTFSKSENGTFRYHSDKLTIR